MSGRDQDTAGDLPPQFAALSQIIDAQPPEMQELFQYALAMLLVEDGKASIVERRTIDGREWIYILTTGHELFGVVEPEVARMCWHTCARVAREGLHEDTMQ